MTNGLQLNVKLIECQMMLHLRCLSAGLHDMYVYIDKHRNVNQDKQPVTCLESHCTKSTPPCLQAAIISDHFVIFQSSLMGKCSIV